MVKEAIETGTTTATPQRFMGEVSAHRRVGNRLRAPVPEGAIMFLETAALRG
jgi:hypothetical protein